jgi:hypothetical protein
LGCRERLPPVHPHIEGTIHTDGESSFGGIELVTTDAEVGEYTIYLRYTLQPKYSLQVTKVVGQKNESIILGNIGCCIGILIKGK